MKDALAETNRDKSLELWQSVFGTEFKKSPPVAVLSQAVVAASDPEQDLERDLRIPVAPQYKVKLVGRVERKDGFRHYALPTRMNEVGKDRWIVFTIDSCTVPDPYEIYWKVRNSGEEAARANQLRGQIFKGVSRHCEDTAYRGSHCVDGLHRPECTCVAHDRQRVLVK